MSWKYNSGGKSRYRNDQAYKENWERIFGKSGVSTGSEEPSDEEHDEVSPECEDEESEAGSQRDPGT